MDQKFQQKKNKYFDFLADSSFQGINRLSVLSFEDQKQLQNSDFRNK